MIEFLIDHMLEHHVKPLIPGVTCEACSKCGGAGWCWGSEIDDADDDTYDDTMTQYTCDWCEGSGKQAEERRSRFSKFSPGAGDRKDDV